MSDAELSISDVTLIARLRDLDTWVETADVPDLAADRIEQLVATNEDLTDAFASLEKAASDVARRGAQIGPQWTKLTIALLVARATLAEIKGGQGDD
jgi:hypothetical protein